jgi:peptide/nickel transport system permease protein
MIPNFARASASHRKSGMWFYFRHDKAAIVGGFMIVVAAILAVIGPHIRGLDSVAQVLPLRAAFPSRAAIFGRDALGRDLFARVIHGARFTLGGAALATTLALCLGIPLGLVAGYYGGYLDAVIMRVTDVLLAFPYFLLAILVVAIIGPGLLSATVAVGITRSPFYIRIVRASTIAVRVREFVVSTRAAGASDVHIVFRHLFPNVLPSIIVSATVGLGTDILSIAGLSFLGLGAQPPTPEWGLMVSEGRSYLFGAPHIMLFPGVSLLALVLGFNLAGDGLRDALDPLMRRAVFKT